MDSPYAPNRPVQLPESPTKPPAAKGTTARRELELAKAIVAPLEDRLMAALHEVESTLVAVIAQALYPNGTAAASATGDACKVYRGWPDPSNLQADLKNGPVNVSVFPLDAEQNVTRYSDDWVPLPTPQVTLTTTVSGAAVTFGGTARCPLNAAVVVNGTAYVYPLQATDTPTSVATALAVLTGGSSNGPVLNLPGATKLEARVGPSGSLFTESKRQKKSFRVTVWCNSPPVRDAVSAVVDSALAARTFLSLADGTQGRLRYERSHTDDASQKSGLYRRDLVYSVEYATTEVLKSAAVVAEAANVTPTPNPL